jgi:hypothetical protein
MAPPKKSSFAGLGDYISGTDTEVETPSTMKPKTSPRKSKNEIWAAKHGPSTKLGTSKPATSPKKPHSAEPVSNVRATRSSSRQPRARPQSEAPPLPTSPAKPLRSPAKTLRSPAKTSQSPTKPSQSPVRSRGRPPAPSAAEKPDTVEKVATAEKPKLNPRRTRTVSPAKRLIADSPPPEDKIDPFPPQPAPMTVTDKPAVRNRYGQKVIAPVDARQTMRQAINFLSDEGVENLADFEEKLERLKRWLDINHPHMHGIIPDYEEDPENLCGRVRYMIWIHENRIREGAEQWFTRDQFPDSASMYKPIKPNKDDQWRLYPDGTTLGKPLDPKNQVMQAQDKEIIAKKRAEKAAAAKASPKKAAPVAAPPKLPELPHPEVWHRKEAARFPYGETPHMEQVMSRQITADLARGKLQLLLLITAPTDSFLQAEKQRMLFKAAPSILSRRSLMA